MMLQLAYFDPGPPTGGYDASKWDLAPNLVIGRAECHVL
jgi:hypothetical protein